MILLHTSWFNISLWDLLLLVAVSSMGTAIAYLHDPRWKALMLSMPIPFTLASLSLGQPLNATNVIALSILLAYTHGVRLLHYRLRLPIVFAILCAALGYCLAGGVLSHMVPRTPTFFWMASLATMALGGLLYLRDIRVPAREEPGYRSPLPMPVKFFAIAGVVALLVFIKQLMQGFMTVFPMVGVIASYESRHSLWTNCQQIHILMLTLTPMMIAIYLAEHYGGLATGWSLALGWVVLFGTLFPVTRHAWATPRPRQHLPAPH